MSKVDWSKAPADAQFYSSGHFRKHDGEVEYNWFADQWGLTGFDFMSWHREQPDFEVRPSLVEWNGQGLPPVGIECEYFRADFNRWVGCTTIGVFRDEMVCAPDGGDFLSGKEENFRPIKSERVKWIDEAVNSLKPALGKFAEEERGICTLIYKALKSGKLPTP